ncbi:hypothetical protein [Desulfohalovibrio reitneri]|uniref:hypothetical protein n=1 Tax=Desulfohalovibrio reitneri TaxID=1307759 RepID=UPI00068A1917|nr:hypothetical protein [Desulfohalovibrio reitneri]
MIKPIHLVCAALLLPLLAGSARAEYLQEYENGSVNWRNGRIEASGVGVAPANLRQPQAEKLTKRGAVIMARRNLLAVLKRINIDSTNTVAEYLASDDAVRSRVRGMLHNSCVESATSLPDDKVEVTVEMWLRKDLADVLLPRTMPFRPESAVAAGREGPGNAGTYSGLVVDARGLGVRPALSPRILDTEGEAVYGPSSVSRAYAVAHGMAGYAESPDLAAQNPRVASRPLVVRAVDATGRNRTDLILSKEDADRVRAVAETNGFLQECRVLVVLD